MKIGDLFSFIEDVPVSYKHTSHKVSLPVLSSHRFPTLLERLLLDITCIGFCDGNKPEYIDSCLKICCHKLLENQAPILPEKK